MKAINKKRIFFLITTIALFITEVLIALYVHDKIIRPYGGDILVTMLVYSFARIIFPYGLKRLTLYVFIFACGIEILQYINFIDIVGLRHNTFVRIVFGASFSWIDIICYGIGCLICFMYEKYEKK